MATTFLLFFLLLQTATLSSSADLLQNPDFNAPPTDLLPGNSSTTTGGDFILLSPNATAIPGWTFEGTVYYLNSSRRRGIQLGPDGKINQTFTTTGAYTTYLLTASAAGASLGGTAGNCTETVGVVVSAPDSRSEVAVGRRGVEEEGWPSYGVYLGTWSAGESVNVVVESESVDVDVNSTCWPIVDLLLLNTIESVVAAKDNLILNGGFESGPEFIPDSTEGTLLDSATSPVQSPLSQWSITGLIKYIDSNHFLVPQGIAAVELISTNSSGIQTAVTLIEGTRYTLEFSLGYPNASCVGDLRARVEAGPTLHTFSVQNNGTGSANRVSLALEGNSSIRTIGFVSSMTTQTKDGVVCGPVIDDVVLRASGGPRVGVQWKQILVGVFFIMLMLI